jgi:hypothetical protein
MNKYFEDKKDCQCAGSLLSTYLLVIVVPACGFSALTPDLFVKAAIMVFGRCLSALFTDFLIKLFVMVSCGGLSAFSSRFFS